MAEDNPIATHERCVCLLSYYGSLLTKTQKDIADSYYLFDLSLSELALSHKISRAAVSESLKTSTDKMESFEKKLGLIAKKEKMVENLDGIIAEPDHDKQIERLKKMKEDLNNGI